MGPSRELVGRRVSRALGMRTWCTCPSAARASPEQRADGTWAPGSSSRLCQALLYRRTEWISAGPPGQRRSAPALSLVPLCLQSFFRQVLFTSSSELKDPLCSRRYRKQARLGGALTLPATCLRLNGPSVHHRSGRAGRAGRAVCRPEARSGVYALIGTEKAEAGTWRNVKALFTPALQAVPTAYSWCVCPSRLDASADVALRRWGF